MKGLEQRSPISHEEVLPYLDRGRGVGWLDGGHGAGACHGKALARPYAGLPCRGEEQGRLAAWPPSRRPLQGAALLVAPVVDCRQSSRRSRTLSPRAFSISSPDIVVGARAALPRIVRLPATTGLRFFAGQTLALGFSEFLELLLAHRFIHIARGALALAFL